MYSVCAYVDKYFVLIWNAYISHFCSWFEKWVCFMLPLCTFWCLEISIPIIWTKRV